MYILKRREHNYVPGWQGLVSWKCQITSRFQITVHLINHDDNYNDFLEIIQIT